MNKKPTKTAAKKPVSQKTIAKKLAVKKVSKPKEKKSLVTPEMFLNQPCKIWNFDNGMCPRAHSMETGHEATPTDFDQVRGFSWGSCTSYGRGVSLVSDPSISMVVVPRVVVVRIPNRFNSATTCWEGEIADTGRTSTNLAAALKAAIKSGAHLQGADLRSADLRSADLQGANLQGAKYADLVIACTRILPEGSLIGWKKLQGGIIAKLRIPEDAKRSHAFGRKCRAEFAEVLELLYKDGSTAPSGNSQHDSSFVYRVGDTVRPSNGFSEEWTEECAPGVHFFITKIEAENY